MGYYSDQMGIDIDLSKIKWDEIGNVLVGEATAQVLQQPDVKQLVKDTGYNVGIQTAAQKTEAFKAQLDKYIALAKKYQHYGFIAAGLGLAYIIYKKMK